MKNIDKYLYILRNDVYKLLPMKQESINGAENHIEEYLKCLLINMEGAIESYKILENEKVFIYLMNNLNYLMKNDSTEMKLWRKIILDSCRNIEELRIKLKNNNKGDTL